MGCGTKEQMALVQDHGWTIGILANHNWSYAGEDNRPDVNQIFLQPFISYTTKDAWTYSLNTESTYDWITHQWSVPINLEIAKLVKFGKQPVQFQAGVRSGPIPPIPVRTISARGSMLSSCSPPNRKNKVH